MKILLDNCVPRPFGRLLAGHEVEHTSRMRWTRLHNGLLLSAAEEAGFQVMITVDQNITYQQRMEGRSISLITLRCRSNDIASLLPLAGLVMVELLSIEPGSVVVVDAPMSR